MALKDVIGQERSINIIFGTLRKNKIPSAYLFAGESGIGKKFTAINLAKAMNCLNPVTRYALRVTSESKIQDPELQTNSELRSTSGGPNSELIDACDECPSCKKINAGTHPDFVAIAPEKGEIRVSEIRAVEDALSFKPYEGRRKVVIIDDADAMNQSAANAFLKTLEEPPDESLLILITAHPDDLPETIRSRCSRINFAPLSPDSCAEVIKTIHGQDRKRTESPRLSTLVRLSMGRPGLIVSSDRVKERERFIGLLQNMLNSDNGTWADREEMEQWLDMMFILLRDMAVLKIIEGTCETSPLTCVGAEKALLNADIRDFISEMAKTNDITGIIKTYDKLTLLKGMLGFNLNKAITWNYTASIMKTAIRNV